MQTDGERWKNPITKSQQDYIVRTGPSWWGGRYYKSFSNFILVNRQEIDLCPMITDRIVTSRHPAVLPPIQSYVTVRFPFPSKRLARPATLHFRNISRHVLDSFIVEKLPYRSSESIQNDKLNARMSLIQTRPVSTRSWASYADYLLWCPRKR